jgi:hypothetical protein
MELGMEVALKKDLTKVFFPLKEVIPVYREQLDKPHVTNKHDLVNVNTFTTLHDLVITPHPLGTKNTKNRWVSLGLEH